MMEREQSKGNITVVLVYRSCDGFVLGQSVINTSSSLSEHINIMFHTSYSQWCKSECVLEHC